MRYLKRAVFLDRDGVINRCVPGRGCPRPPASLAEVDILPGVADALLVLKAYGFLAPVVTNQPDVARGTTARHVVEEINAYLARRLALDHFFVCWHDDVDRCECRKPQPGLLIRAAQILHIDLARSYMVGDRWRDVEAGANAGCRTILITNGYAERAPAQPPDATAESLIEAVAWILYDQQRKEAA
jgi:D-glycero-D-manno-heptose 1,7-bisphosphate phosphatase